MSVSATVSATAWRAFVNASCSPGSSSQKWVERSNDGWIGVAGLPGGMPLIYTAYACASLLNYGCRDPSGRGADRGRHARRTRSSILGYGQGSPGLTRPRSGARPFRMRPRRTRLNPHKRTCFTSNCRIRRLDEGRRLLSYVHTVEDHRSAVFFNEERASGCQDETEMASLLLRPPRTIPYREGPG